MGFWFEWLGSDLSLRLRIQPRASKNEIVGPHGAELKVRITAPPVDGAANAHLVKFLTKEFGVPKQQINILSGENGRQKRILISNPSRLPSTIAKFVCKQ